MSGVIIVEGPDGSGKTTLIKNLQNRFVIKNLKAKRHGPPVDAEDLYERTKDLLMEATHSNVNCIIDRFGLIGEQIYGPICRGKDLWVDIPEKRQEIFSAFNTLNPFIIYCRPPANIIANLSNHEVKEYDTPEHLKSLHENQALIIRSYDNFFANWKSYNFFIWDYTKPENYYDLVKRLEEYLKW